MNLAKGLGSKVTVMNVTEPAPIFASAGMYGPVATARDRRLPEAGEEYGAKVLNAATERAEELGVMPRRRTSRRCGAEAINQIAQDQGSRPVVMALHGRRGLGWLILGSQTVDVPTNSRRRCWSFARGAGGREPLAAGTRARPAIAA